MQWFNIGMMNSNSTAEDVKKKLHFHLLIHLIRTQHFLKRELKIEERFDRQISLYRVESYGETFKMPLRSYSAIYIKFNFTEGNSWTIYDKNI